MEALCYNGGMEEEIIDCEWLVDIFCTNPDCPNYDQAVIVLELCNGCKFMCKYKTIMIKARDFHNIN